MIAPLIVALVILAIGASFVWIRRSSRAEAADAEGHLKALASRLGTTADAWAKTRTLTGALNGRSCSVAEGGVLSRGKSTNYYVHIKMPITTPVSFELHPQTSSLGARLVGDVELGDPDFDKNFILRTSDLERARRAVPPPSRPALIKWVRTGQIARIYVKDGALHYEGGFGLHKASHFEVTNAVLDTLEPMAQALE